MDKKIKYGKKDERMLPTEIRWLSVYAYIRGLASTNFNFDFLAVEAILSQYWNNQNVLKWKII